MSMRGESYCARGGCSVVGLTNGRGSAGHLADCIKESAVVLICALTRIGIESFSVVTFGSKVLPMGGVRHKAPR